MKNRTLLTLVIYSTRAPLYTKKIGQGLLLTGDPHVMVVPPKYFFHAINVQQLIYVLYNFDEIALSHTVKEIQAILYFAIFGKNWKIQNGRHFWGGENFSENCQ